MAQIRSLRAGFDSVPSLHVTCAIPGPGGGIGRRYGLKRVRLATEPDSTLVKPRFPGGMGPVEYG